jgi:hypothetical protein
MPITQKAKGRREWALVEYCPQTACIRGHSKLFTEKVSASFPSLQCVKVKTERFPVLFFIQEIGEIFSFVCFFTAVSLVFVIGSPRILVEYS